MLNSDNFIGFYRERDKYGFMSNWYKAEFEYAGKTYAHSEQFMMYQKASMFGQFDIAEQIMATKDPGKCKELGGSHFDNWNTELWDSTSYAVVKRGVKAKFYQNKDLLRMLLMSGNCLLAECSPTDTKWGIGIGPEDDARFDVTKWQGKNLLGRMLMDIREEFRRYDLMAPERFMFRKYNDVYEAYFPSQEWEMTMGELIRIPLYHDTVSAYSLVIKYLHPDKYKEMYSMRMCDIEKAIKDSGAYPVQGFFELKQDLYEIANDMFAGSSGL